MTKLGNKYSIWFLGCLLPSLISDQHLNKGLHQRLLPSSNSLESCILSKAQQVKMFNACDMDISCSIGQGISLQSYVYCPGWWGGWNFSVHASQKDDWRFNFYFFFFICNINWKTEFNKVHMITLTHRWEKLGVGDLFERNGNDHMILISSLLHMVILRLSLLPNAKDFTQKSHKVNPLMWKPAAR